MVAETELPFGNERIYNITRGEVSSDKLKQILRETSTDGVSVCVRTERGPAERGGYLFHYRKEEENIRMEYFPFNPEDKARFEDWEEFSRFVTHAIGEEWDEEMYERSLQIVTRIE